jgi:pimeloyl-ACP methyl ester carboxylesterase
VRWLPAAPAAHASGLGQMLWDYTLEYIRLLDERRVERFQALHSPADLETLRETVRSRLLEMWGPLPAERTELNAKSLGSIPGDDYLIERIIFESRPKFYVTANLYRPKTTPERLPAILFPPGHTAEGKAYEPYQRFGILGARHGFAVLIWDPIGQGERLQLWDPALQASLVGPDTAEHSALGQQCYLLGLNLMQYRIWDAGRAIDYLETRDDIDSERIGMAGSSGGGMETLQFAAFEPRIKVAIPVSAVATFRAKTEALRIADPEQVLYGTLRYGIDHPELLAAFAPRPLMIGAPTQDFIPIDAARSTFNAVVEAYSLLDAAGKLRFTETNDKHGMNQQLREAAIDWMLRWLTDNSHAVHEAPVKILSEQELRCTNSGQVADTPGAASVTTWNHAYAKQIAPGRKVPAGPSEFEIYQSQIIQGVREISRVGEFRPEVGILVPDRVFEVGAFARGEALVVAERGMNDPEVRREVIDPIVAAGYQVVAIDVRGWGETAPKLPDFDVGFDWDDFFAYRGLEIGRPLLGQRVKDVLAAAPKRLRNREWLVVGVGAGALVAAHAAALEPRITQLITVDGLLSYRSLLEDPLTKQPFSSFLPGVLGAYDVRDLYAALAPRRVLVINPQDSQRQTMQLVPAREELDWVNQVYENLEATDNFSLHSELSTRKVREVIMGWLAG